MSAYGRDRSSLDPTYRAQKMARLEHGRRIADPAVRP